MQKGTGDEEKLCFNFCTFLKITIHNKNNKLDKRVIFLLNVIFHLTDIISSASFQKQAHHNTVMMGLPCLVLLNRNFIRRFFLLIFSVAYSRPWWV